MCPSTWTLTKNAPDGGGLPGRGAFPAARMDRRIQKDPRGCVKPGGRGERRRLPASPGVCSCGKPSVLLARPRIRPRTCMVLDEPVSGVDKRACSYFWTGAAAEGKAPHGHSAGKPRPAPVRKYATTWYCWTRRCWSGQPRDVFPRRYFRRYSHRRGGGQLMDGSKPCWTRAAPGGAQFFSL
jgi:hypothetical protein